MRSILMIGPMVGLIGLLGGCGASQPGRTEGGMAAGAATGGAIGLIGGPVGVVIGAAAGAGAGALTSVGTSPQKVNLGTPPWGQPPAGGGVAPYSAVPPANQLAPAGQEPVPLTQSPVGQNPAVSQNPLPSPPSATQPGGASTSPAVPSQ